MDLVAISVDTAEDSEALRQKLKLTLPLLSDEEVSVISSWGVEMKDGGIAIPATFVIDTKGKVIWAHVGETMMDRADLESVIQAVTGR